MLKTLSYSKNEGIIVYLCMNGQARFSEIQDYLGINPSMVDRRLKQLMEEGIVGKDGDLYKITSKGREAAVAYNLHAQDKCDEYCEPQKCVGPLHQAESIIDRYTDSVAHQILRVLPGRVDDIEEEVRLKEGSVHEHIIMYQRWDFVEVNEGMVSLTEKGRKVLTLLECS